MIDYIKELCHKIKMLAQSTILVKSGNNVVDDTGNARTGWAYISGRAQKVRILSPYGLCSNPPLGSSGLVINSNGGGSYPTAIVDYHSKRYKDLKPGESVIGNYEKGSYIKFDDNGDIQIFTSGNVFINGSVYGATSADPVTMPKGILVNGKTINDTHKHVETNTSETGGVI
jgi:phage gp45-like